MRSGMVPERARQGEEDSQPGRDVDERRRRCRTTSAGQRSAGLVRALRGPLFVAADRSGPSLHPVTHRPGQSGRVQSARRRRR